jgi:hypothetical protein
MATFVNIQHTTISGTGREFFELDDEPDVPKRERDARLVLKL